MKPLVVEIAKYLIENDESYIKPYLQALIKLEIIKPFGNVYKFYNKFLKSKSTNQKLYDLLENQLIETNYVTFEDLVGNHRINFGKNIEVELLKNRDTAPKENLPVSKISEKDIDLFFKEVVFAVNYPNEVKLSRIIEKKLGSTWSLLNTKLISDSYLVRMLDWFKHKDGKWLKPKDGEKIFENIKTILNTQISVGLGMVYPAKLRRKYCVTFKEGAIENLLHQVEEFLAKDISILNIIRQNDYEKDVLSTLKLEQVIEKLSDSENINKPEIEKYLNKKDSYMFIDSKMLQQEFEQKKIINSFDTDGSHNLLIIDCQSKDMTNGDFLVEKISNVLKKNILRKENEKKKVILITSKNDIFASKFKSNPKYSFYNDFTVFVDFDDTNYYLSSKKIIFQGIQTKLNTITDDVDPFTLNHLIRSEKIEIGTSLLDDALIFTKENDVVRNFSNLKDGENIILIEHVTDKNNENYRMIIDFETGEFNTDIWNGPKNDPGIYTSPTGITEEEFKIICNKICDDNLVLYLLSWKDQELKLKEFYDPGAIIQSVKYQADSSKLIEDRSYLEQSFILSAEKGKGKSTFLKKLVRKETLRSRSKLILYIDLVKCQDALAKIPQKITDTNVFLTFLENSKNLNMDGYIIIKAIEMKLKSGEKQNLVLVFDGFDKINGSLEIKTKEYKKNLINLMKLLQNKAILWVAAQPNDMEFLKNLELPVMNLEPINKSQRDYYLGRILKADTQLTLYNNEYSFLKNRLDNGIIPLLDDITIDESTLELFGQELRESLSGDINIPSSIYDVYHNFIDSKFKSLTNSKKKTKLEFYIAFALYRKFPEEYKKLKKNLKIFSYKQLTKNAKDEDIDSLKLFENKNVADYFICQLIKSRFEDKDTFLAEFLHRKVLVTNDSALIRRLFDSELVSINYNSLLSRYSEVLSDFSKEMSTQNVNTALQLASIESNTHIADFLIDNLEQIVANSQETYEKKLPDQVVNYVKNKNNYNENILHILASSNNHILLKKILQLWEKCDEDFKKSITMDLLSQRDESGNTPLHIAIMKKNKNFVNEFISYSEILKLDKQSFINLLVISNENGDNALNLALKSKDIIMIDTVLSEINELEADNAQLKNFFLVKLPFGHFNNQNNVLHQSLLIDDDSVLESVLTALKKNAGSKKMSDKEIIENSLLFGQDNQNRTPLTVAAYLKKYEAVQNLLDYAREILPLEYFQDLLKVPDHGQKSVLHHAVDKNDGKLVEIILNVVDKQTLEEILTIPDSDKSKITLLEKVVKNSQLEVLKLFLDEKVWELIEGSEIRARIQETVSDVVDNLIMKDDIIEIEILLRHALYLNNAQDLKKIFIDKFKEDKFREKMIGKNLFSNLPDNQQKSYFHLLIIFQDHEQLEKIIEDVDDVKIKFLLERGNEDTALELLVKNHNHKIAQLLLERAKKLTIPINSLINVKNEQSIKRYLPKYKKSTKLKKITYESLIAAYEKLDNGCSTQSKKKRSIASCNIEKILKDSKDKIFAWTIDSAEVIKYLEINKNDPQKVNKMIKRFNELENLPFVQVKGRKSEILDQIGFKGLDYYRKKERITNISKDILRRDDSVKPIHNFINDKALTYINRGLMIKGIINVVHGCLGNPLSPHCGLGVAALGYSFGSEPLAFFVLRMYENKLSPNVMQMIVNYEKRISKIVGDSRVSGLVKIMEQKQLIGKTFIKSIAAASMVFDVISIYHAVSVLKACADKENTAEQCHEKIIRDSYAEVTFSGLSAGSTLVAIVFSLPVAGLVTVGAIIGAQAVYYGISNVIEYQKYDTSLMEDVNIFFRSFGNSIIPFISPVPKHIEQLEIISRYYDSMVQEFWKMLQDSPENVIGIAAGLGNYNGKESEPVYSNIDLSRNNYTIILSRIKINLPTNASSPCRLAMNMDNQYGLEKKQFLEKQYSCKNAVVLQDDNRKDSNQHQDKYMMYYMQLMRSGHVLASPEYNSVFYIYNENIQIWGSPHKKNIFNVFGSEPSGTVFMMMNSTNIINTENIQSQHVTFLIKMELLGSNYKRNSFAYINLNQQNQSNFQFYVKDTYSKPITLQYFGQSHRVDNIHCTYAMGQKLSVINPDTIVVNSGGGVNLTMLDFVTECNNTIINPFTSFKSQKSNLNLYVEFNDYSDVNATSTIDIKSSSATKANVIFNGISLLSNRTRFKYLKNSNTLSIEMSTDNNLNYSLQLKEFITNSSSYLLVNKKSQIVPIAQDSEDVKDFINFDSCHTPSTNKLYSLKDIISIYQTISSNFNIDYQIYTQLSQCWLKGYNSTGDIAHFGSNKPDLIQVDHKSIFLSGKNNADYYIINIKDDEAYTTWIDNESNDSKLDSLLLYSKYNITSFKPELTNNNTDLKLTLSENNPYKQSIVIIDYAKGKKYQHIFFMDINRNTVIPMLQNNEVALVPFYRANAEQDTFIISANDLKKSEAHSAVIDIDLNNIVYDKKENHLFLLSKKKIQVPTLNIIFQDYFVNSSNWENVNLYFYHEGNYISFTPSHIRLTDFDEYAHDDLIQEYKVEGNKIINHYNISDESKLSLFTFKDVSLNNLEASTTDGSIILFDKESKTTVNISGLTKNVGFEFEAGLRPIRFYVNDNNDTTNLQNQISNASTIYKNIKDSISFRLDTIMNCILFEIEDDSSIDSELQQNDCSFSLDELESLNADSYIKTLFSRVTLMGYSNNDTVIQSIISDIKKNVIPKLETIAVRIKFNTYLLLKLNEIPPNTLYEVARFLKDRTDLSFNNSETEIIMYQLLTDLLDTLEENHSNLNDQMNHRASIKKILADSVSGEAVRLITYKAYNQVFSSNPKLSYNLKRIKFDCLYDILSDKNVDDLLEELRGEDLEYDRIISMVENDSIKVEISSRLNNLLSEELDEDLQVDDQSFSTDFADEITDIVDTDDNIDDLFFESSTEFKDYTTISENILGINEDLGFNQETNTPLINQTFNSNEGNNTNNLKTINGLDVNSNLILAQLLSHKLFGKNDTLNATRYISDEVNRQIALNQSALEILPLLNNNGSAHNNQSFINNFENQPQWYQDLMKDNVKEVKEKRD